VTFPREQLVSLEAFLAILILAILILAKSGILCFPHFVVASVVRVN
jgi:hypothetical protein